jgi:hypothetical protein
MPQGVEATVLARTALDIERKRGSVALGCFIELLADEHSNNWRIAREFDLSVFSVAVARKALTGLSLDLLVYFLSFPQSTEASMSRPTQLLEGVAPNQLT